MTVELLRDMRVALLAAKDECTRLRNDRDKFKLRAFTAERMFESEHQLTERLRRVIDAKNAELKIAESKWMNLVLAKPAAPAGRGDETPTQETP